jgi:4-hydroxy-3-polyprenylbenzoate decarboxylase
MTSRVVVGLSGASGAVVGLRILEILSRSEEVETHLVVSKAARQTLRHELGPQGVPRVEALADVVHPIGAIGATIASGSFRTEGMIVAPCSIRTLSSIACGLSDNLLTRVADVHLKERRPLVLMVREAPLHLGHLRAMTAATEMGAIVFPPVPAFYRPSQTMESAVDQIARRALDLLKLPSVEPPESWPGLDYRSPC